MVCSLKKASLFINVRHLGLQSTWCCPAGRQSQLENVRLQRLNALNAMRSLAGIKHAADWIEQEAHKGRFRGQVFGPIAVEVECRDREHVKYLDQHCAGQEGLVLGPSKTGAYMGKSQ